MFRNSKRRILNAKFTYLSDTDRGGRDTARGGSDTVGKGGGPGTPALL